MKRISLFMATAALLAASTALAPAATVTARMKAAVADPARPEADKARDENRKPADMLAFAGITPGKVVVDLLPGAGYFTRIFARAVEPGGPINGWPEGARIEIDRRGHITVTIGFQSSGQAHESMVTQIMCEEFGVRPGDVTVNRGDGLAGIIGGATTGSG